MEYITIDHSNRICLNYVPPQDGAVTFVFFNAIGGSAAAWEATIAPALRESGYGTLTFDYRGQGETIFGVDATLDPEEINGDSLLVCRNTAPPRPVFVGNSIGGLFAAQTWLSGAPAEGLALVNTLRKPGPKVEWINTLESRLIALGGMRLVYDVLRPNLVSPERLSQIRASHLSEEPYEPFPEDHPRRRLADNVFSADWALPYEALTLPVLVVTGRHDRLFRVQDDVDELLARLPEAYSTEVSDGGHALHMEFPDRFVRMLDEFASKNLSGMRNSLGTASSAQG